MNSPRRRRACCQYRSVLQATATNPRPPCRLGPRRRLARMTPSTREPSTATGTRVNAWFTYLLDNLQVTDRTYVMPSVPDSIGRFGVNRNLTHGLIGTGKRIFHKGSRPRIKPGDLIGQHLV